MRLYELDESYLGGSRAPLYIFLHPHRWNDVFLHDKLTPQPKGTRYMGKSYNVSFLTRNPNLDWGTIGLELDADKLRQRHKLIPSGAEYNISNHDVLKFNILGGVKDGWREEWVVGPVPNLHKYINKIFIPNARDVYQARQRSAPKFDLNVIEEYSEKYNIPIEIGSQAEWWNVPPEIDWYYKEKDILDSMRPENQKAKFRNKDWREKFYSAREIAKQYPNLK
jgi:hypothetical protein